MAVPMNISNTIPPPEDLEGITQASRDYIEGWYSADAERMQRCLHPDLVKRTLQYDAQADRWQLRGAVTSDRMIEHTRTGGGSGVPQAERTYEITILDVFRHIASVKLISRDMVDYLHLIKLNERWYIINVLWEVREGELGVDD